MKAFLKKKRSEYARYLNINFNEKKRKKIDRESIVKNIAVICDMYKIAK